MFSVQSGVLGISMLIRGIILGLIVGLCVLLWKNHSNQFSTEGELKVGLNGMECHEAFKGTKSVPCEEINLAYDLYMPYQVGEHEARVAYEEGDRGSLRFAGAGWSENGMVYDPPQE